MKKLSVKKFLAFALAFSVAVFCLGLSACGFRGSDAQQSEKMDFEYTLTEDDVTEALALVSGLEEYIDNGRNRKIADAAKAVEDAVNYIEHQYSVGTLKYYCDMENEEYRNMYYISENCYLQVYEESIRVLKKLYNSQLKAKEQFFADWTDTELKNLAASSDEIMALEKEQKDILRRYLELDYDQTEEWSESVDELYFEFVNSAQQLAHCYGYENYYEYSAKEIYMREYSEEQRKAYRENVKKYILPFYIKTDKLYSEKRSQLTEEQKEQFSAMTKNSCDLSNELFAGYINSYPEKMKKLMYNMFDRDAAVYSQSENAYDAAFTDYSLYCDQPYVYFGKGMQDMLTVVHEMGHYVSYYHFEDASLPYDTCEVQSQGNEWLFINYIDEKTAPDIYELYMLRRLVAGLDSIVVCALVDEYEEAVYTSDISSPDDFRQIMHSVLEGYNGIDAVNPEDYWYEYSQYVALPYPVYYMNYSTSELVSMLFYALAEEEGYETAQDIYIKLCLETPADAVFFDTLMDIGMPDPFEKETMLRIVNVFEDILADSPLQQAA